MKTKLLVLCTCIAFVVSALNAAEFSVAKGSHIGFKVKKFAVMSVEGSFKEFSGALSIDESGNITTPCKAKLL